MLTDQMLLIENLLSKECAIFPMEQNQGEQIAITIQKVKISWREALFSGCEDRNLHRYFNYHLEGISKISDTLYRQNPEPVTNYQPDIQAEILHLIDHLFEKYRDYLNYHARASIAYQLRWYEHIGATVDQIIYLINASTIDIQLKSYLTEFLRKIDHPLDDDRHTYRSLFYLEHFINMLSAVMNNNSFSDLRINDLLLELNFNHLGYFSHRQQQYHLLSAGMDYQEKLAFFQQELVKLKAQPEQSRYVYHMDWPSLKTMLTNFLREEIAFAKECLPKCEVGTSISLTDKIPLNLSVAQLACLIRVLFEEGCFGDLNLQDLFKFFSLHFRTKRQEQISNHSLSKEYYSVNQITAAVMRDKFTKMITWLNQNFFPVLIAASAIIGVY